MNQQFSITQARDWWMSYRLGLEPKELKFLAGKSTFRGLLLHAMSPFYYRRERLWKEGTLFWVYVFKVASPMGQFFRPLPGWVLFSPASSIQDHPETYLALSNELLAWVSSKASKKRPKLKTTLESMTSEPLMIPLPEELTAGKPVYLSSVTFYPDQFDFPENGLLLAVGHLSLTQEIMLLPKKYNQQIKTFYGLI